MTPMPQVVIVGAGPTGATLALLLAQHNIRVTLIEASRNFHRVFRGEGLMPSGLEALDQMGLSSIIDRIPHQPLKGWEVIIEKRSLFRVAEPLEAGSKACTLVSQPAFLSEVIRAAQQFSTFEFLPDTSVQDLVWSENRVIGIKLNNGSVLESDLVIGADGRNSIVRKRADLTLETQSQPFNILWFKLASSSQFETNNIFYMIAEKDSAFSIFHSAEGNLHVGWAVLEDDRPDGQEVDWIDRFAAASPPWLADYFRQNADTLERPILLSVVVGRCPQWYKPGLLLLGDAAHPLSPIRAQGINMALRDVVVAANHLIPLLKEASTPQALDEAIAAIQAEREPDIIGIQRLQQEEVAQAELVKRNPLLKFLFRYFTPLMRYPAQQSWLRRQLKLRRGFTQVQLSSFI